MTRQKRLKLLLLPILLVFAVLTTYTHAFTLKYQRKFSTSARHKRSTLTAPSNTNLHVCKDDVETNSYTAGISKINRILDPLAKRKNDEIIVNIGLYRPFANTAWQALIDTNWFDTRDYDGYRNDDGEKLDAIDYCSVNKTSLLLQMSKSAVAKGFPPGSFVTMTTRVMHAKDDSPVSYARFALLETIVANTAENHKNMESKAKTVGVTSKIHTAGIQVLNMVVFPNTKSDWPVWGADLVSLPGNKHLLLLDAQPMSTKDYASRWKDWFDTYNDFDWGGDLPDPVKKYVSQYALWTRMGATSTKSSNDEEKDPIQKIQTKVFDAFVAHLEIYLQFLKNQSNLNESTTTNNWMEDYRQYRLQNDPARPMLKSLYGEEWCEEVLTKVLFPPL